MNTQISQDREAGRNAALAILESEGERRAALIEIAKLFADDSYEFRAGLFAVLFS